MKFELDPTPEALFRNEQITCVGIIRWCNGEVGDEVFLYDGTTGSRREQYG